MPFKKNDGLVIIVDNLKDHLKCQVDASSIYYFTNEPPESPTAFYFLDSIISLSADGLQNMALGVYFSDSKSEEIIEFLMLKEENDDLTIININTYKFDSPIPSPNTRVLPPPMPRE